MSYKNTFNVALIAFVAILSLLVISLVFSVNVNAQDSSEQEIETTSEESAESIETETDATFSYVAQPGDSYSLMARKAIQTYGIVSNVNLSGAQILYAETNITRLVGSPILVLGQNVDIEESVVSDWVQRAQDLSEEEKAAWELYVPFADFNTNAVGQTQS
jgi:hypothetical protein